MGKLRTSSMFGMVAAVAACAGCGSSDTEPDGTGSGGSAATTTGSGTGTETGATGTGNGTGSGGGGTGATTSGTGSGGTGSGGAPSFEGFTRVDVAGAAVPGGADVAIAPDGTIYVSWVAETAGARDVFFARSTDGGETFGAPVQLDDAAIEPLVSMARHPYVAADDARVAVTFNDEGGTVRLYVAPADTLAFAPAVVVGGDITTDFRDFPKPLFLGDGNLLVAWQGYPASGARIFVSRETAEFASEAASEGAPGVPCECCPLDLLASDGGDAIAAFRNNDGNEREMWSALAPGGGAFSSWAAISTSEGTIPSCPMQGPRLAQIGASTVLGVWSSRGAGAGAAFVASSSDGGASWSGGVAIDGFQADEPTIAVGASGRVFVTGVTGSGASSMVWSDDDGASWSAPEPIAAPDGAIAVPQAEGAGGIAALAGVSDAGSVWLRRME